MNPIIDLKLKNNLATFPKECSCDPIDQWFLALQLELTQLLDEAKLREFGVGGWPYEYGRIKATQELLESLLGKVQSRRTE
jgi:hypothetical protein